jgi:hypothetical protein
MKILSMLNVRLGCKENAKSGVLLAMPQERS